MFSNVDPNEFAVKGLGHGFLNVKGAAMHALHRMDLPNSPTKGLKSIGGPADIQLWQNWWKENAQQLLSEYPPASSATADEPPPVAATPEPRPTITPPPAALSTPAPIVLRSEPPPSNWYPLAAAVVLLLALGFYRHFRRKGARF